MVVDDEPSIRDLLSASLRFSGFEVLTAADGYEAVEVAERTNPDLVVLDVMLPDLDGFEVARRIGVPVLFLTARDNTEDKIVGLGVGDDYVTKPFSLEEVQARIRAVLRRTRGENPPRAASRSPTWSWTRRPARSGVTGGRYGCRRPSSSCCTTSCPTPAECCPRRRSSTTCGTTTSAATPAWSSRTSPTCGARSTTSSPGSSTRCAASDTCCGSPRRASVVLWICWARWRGCATGSIASCSARRSAAVDDRRALEELTGQLDDYLLPRLPAIDAPLLAVVGGSTGAGKSTLVDSLVGATSPRPGVLRPTTLVPTLVVTPGRPRVVHRPERAPGPVREPPSARPFHPDPRRRCGGHLRVARRRLALLDAPDIDWS